MVDQTRVDWRGKTHFFAIAAQAMRRILASITPAGRAGARHGGDWKRVTLDASVADKSDGLEPAEFLALDAALTKLASVDPREAQVVELRFFVGLSNEDIASLSRRVNPQRHALNGCMRAPGCAGSWLGGVTRPPFRHAHRSTRQSQRSPLRCLSGAAVGARRVSGSVFAGDDLVRREVESLLSFYDDPPETATEAVRVRRRAKPKARYRKGHIVAGRYRVERVGRRRHGRGLRRVRRADA